MFLVSLGFVCCGMMGLAGCEGVNESVEDMGTGRLMLRLFGMSIEKGNDCKWSGVQ